MDRDQPNKLTRMFFMALAVVMVVLLYMVVSPARAEIPEGVQPTEIDIDCGDFMCVVPKDQLHAVFSANRKMAAALADKPPPKCGTLEVEPKTPPRIKGDPRTEKKS